MGSQLTPEQLAQSFEGTVGYVSWYFGHIRPADTEDMAQEIRLEIWRAVIDGRLTSPEQSAYVASLARHVCRNYIKRRLSAAHLPRADRDRGVVVICDSLDAPIGPDTDTTLGDTIPAQQPVTDDGRQFSPRVRRAVAALTPRQRAAIDARYGGNGTEPHHSQDYHNAVRRLRQLLA